MEETMKRLLIVSSVLCLGAGVALAATDTCPEPVTAAINKAYPASTVTSCKKEVEKGTTLYEVKVTTKQASKVEVDVTPDGKIVQTEEKVSLEAVPKAVMDGFTAKYKDAKATGAEKQIKADGSIQYELKFVAGKKKKEVTFSEGGKFLEEE
jgi:Putative beta-lactamase-inhibitor-like, PepSY-like